MKDEEIVGRSSEIKILKETLKSSESEFLAIYGRRRVGKTYLINKFFSNSGTYFEVTGQKDGLLQDQLEIFIDAYSKYFYEGLQLRTPASWREAFQLLDDKIQSSPKSKKFVIFLDELPWLASKKSNLMQVIDHFWNAIWCKMPNVILIVCGSAASWMIDRLINAKGGLYNRLTKVIHLQPYNLKGTQEFLHYKGMDLKPMQVLDIYMALGGIPHYLKQIRKGKSAVQNINDICFQEDGILYTEFNRLFDSLFDHSDTHKSIIREIGNKREGISRDDLIEKTGIKSGGRLNKRLEELESSSFIQSYVPLGKKRKDKFYRISDEYTYFYLKWIEPLVERGASGGRAYWQAQSKTQSAITWKGYAFEMVCYKHIDQIRSGLDLEEIFCEIGPWRYLPRKGSHESGAQIDLMFDRDDDAITICEVKYSDKVFTIDKKIAKNLTQKIMTLDTHYSADKQIFIALITTKGIKRSIWSDDLVQNEVTLNELFVF